MSLSIVLGTGEGRCGANARTLFLNQQPEFDVTHESRALLPWMSRFAAELMRERFGRIRRKRQRHAAARITRDT